MPHLTEQQLRILQSARIGHLATSNAQASPYVIPVCFASDGQSIYSVLDRKPKRAALTKLRRVRNILENPRASLVVDHYEEDWSSLWYMLITGPAELLEEGAERSASIPLLRAKYQQYRQMDIDDNPVIKLIPERIVSWGLNSEG